MRIGLNKSTKTAKVHAFPGNRVITRKKLSNTSSRTGLSKRTGGRCSYVSQSGWRCIDTKGHSGNHKSIPRRP